MMKSLFRIRFQRLHVFQNETDHYIAFDEEDCEKAYEECTGESRIESEGDGIVDNPFIRIKDSKLITLLIEDEDDVKKFTPLFSRIKRGNETTCTEITAPAWAWILLNGRGFMSSTEW